MCFYVFGMNINESAAVKITAEKFFIGKIYVLKKQAVCTKTYNLFMSCNVIINILLDFSRIWNMVKAVTFFFCKIAVFVKRGKCVISAMSWLKESKSTKRSQSLQDSISICPTR